MSGSEMPEPDRTEAVGAANDEPGADSGAKRPERESDGTGAAAKITRFKLPKAARLPAGGPYARVFQRRWAVSDEHITINFGPNGLAWHRLGLGVTKKMFRRAVDRNDVKRLIREAYRLERPGFGSGLDIVVRPRHRAMSLETLRASIRALVPRAERKFAAKTIGANDPKPTSASPGPANPEPGGGG